MMLIFLMGCLGSGAPSTIGEALEENRVLRCEIAGPMDAEVYVGGKVWEIHPTQPLKIGSHRIDYIIIRDRTMYMHNLDGPCNWYSLPFSREFHLDRDRLLGRWVYKRDYKYRCVLAPTGHYFSIVGSVCRFHFGNSTTGG